MPTIAAVCNFFNECNALPGWLESASQWADHILLYDCGPGGERSSDGSIEIAEKWGVELKHGSIDEGFGVVRTKLVTMPPCDWTWIGDADERINKFAPYLACNGDERYPQDEHPNLTVRYGGVYNQFDKLKDLLQPQYDAIVVGRRHWFNHHYDSPCQNWQRHPDWQARILRNCPHVGYRSDIRMHEQLVDFRHGGTPSWYQPTIDGCEVWIDHFHCFYKAMEREQRLHDIAIYDKIHAGEKPPSLHEFLNPNV